MFIKTLTAVSLVAQSFAVGLPGEQGPDLQPSPSASTPLMQVTGSPTDTGSDNGIQTTPDSEDTQEGRATSTPVPSVEDEPDGSEDSTPRKEVVDSYAAIDALAKDNTKVLANGVYTIASSANTNNVIDVADGSWSENANIQLYKSNGSTAQKFRVSHDDAGYVLIESLVSGKRLEVAGTAKAGANVRQHTKSDGRAQKWVAVKKGSSIQLVSGLSRDDTMYALDGSGSNVQLGTMNNSSAQKWTFTSTPLITPGVYRIYSMVASDNIRSLDITNASVSGGANVQIATSNNTLAQSFYISTPDSRGGVFIQPLCSGLFVGGKTSGNVAQLYGKDAALHRWKVVSQADGSFGFVNVSTGQALSVAGNSSVSGANVKVRTSDAGSGQKWRIAARTTVFPNGLYSVHAKSSWKKVVSVQGGARRVKANVELRATSSVNWKKWFATKNSDGTYTFTSAHSAQALSLSGNSAAQGVNVIQNSKKSTANQRFRIVWDSNIGGFKIASALNSNYILELSGKNGPTSNGANVRLGKTRSSVYQRFTFKAESMPAKVYWQNPSNMYQVSSKQVQPRYKNQGAFSYVSPNKISATATRAQVVEAFVGRALEYIGTRYVWDYALAPGQGVDCAGLVLQAMYAVGINPARYNPYDHFFTPGHDHYANDMRNDPRIKHVPYSQRKRGDLVFYSGHVAIYLGNNQIVHASGRNVHIAGISTPGKVLAIGRLFN